jgi:hypothetical protein
MSELIILVPDIVSFMPKDFNGVDAVLVTVGPRKLKDSEAEFGSLTNFNKNN